jgi:hypothetical protein
MNFIGTFKRRPFLEFMEEQSSKFPTCEWSFFRLNFKTFDHELRQGIGQPVLEQLSKNFKYDVPFYYYMGHVQENKDITKPIISLDPIKEKGNKFFYYKSLLISELSLSQSFVDCLFDEPTFAESLISKFKKDDNEYAGCFIKKPKFVSFFTNKEKALFFDREGTICTREFEKSKPIESNFIYNTDFSSRKYIKEEA